MRSLQILPSCCSLQVIQNRIAPKPSSGGISSNAKAPCRKGLVSKKLLQQGSGNLGCTQGVIRCEELLPYESAIMIQSEHVEFASSLKLNPWLFNSTLFDWRLSYVLGVLQSQLPQLLGVFLPFPLGRLWSRSKKIQETNWGAEWCGLNVFCHQQDFSDANSHVPVWTSRVVLMTLQNWCLYPCFLFLCSRTWNDCGDDGPKSSEIELGCLKHQVCRGESLPRQVFRVPIRRDSLGLGFVSPSAFGFRLSAFGFGFRLSVSGFRLSPSVFGLFSLLVFRLRL